MPVPTPSDKDVAAREPAAQAGPSGAGPADSTVPEDAALTAQRIEEALRAARELLGMQIAWIAEFRDGKKVFRAVDGDEDSFGFHEGGDMPLDGSYCVRVARGAIPNAIPDTALEPAVRDLEVTRTSAIRSYVGVPIERVDGTVYGTLCCASHRPNGVAEQDVRFLRGISRRLAGFLEEQRLRSTGTDLLTDG